MAQFLGRWLRQMGLNHLRPSGVIMLSLLVCTCWFLLSSRQMLLSRSKSTSLRKGPVEGHRQIHVCLCSDDTDLRPAAVAIMSAHQSASEPERLVFHYITTPEFAPLFRELFRVHLPGINIEVHHNAKLQAHIQSYISFRESSKARKILASPFNFAPFYLREYLMDARGDSQSIQRVIYIDTDTLILGDMGELQDMDMKGHSCAAVRYCLQHWGDYINFPLLREIGFHNYDPKHCIANRGVMVVDTARWMRENMTGKIEQWMVHYRNAREDLWYGGMSQPPWLLAMNGSYFELGDEWNCNGLGRESMSPFEGQTLRRGGFDRKALHTLGVTMEGYGSILPFVVTCSGTGKLLHYNGAMKPWFPERFTGMWPACSIPQGFPDPKHPWVWSRDVRVFCEPVKFVSCQELWSYYISEETACALKDFDKEWAEEEEKWANLLKADEAAAAAQQAALQPTAAPQAAVQQVESPTPEPPRQGEERRLKAEERGTREDEQRQSTGAVMGGPGAGGS